MGGGRSRDPPLQYEEPLWATSGRAASNLPLTLSGVGPWTPGQNGGIVSKVASTRRIDI